MSRIRSMCYRVVASLFFASATVLMAQEAVPVMNTAMPKEAATALPPQNPAATSAQPMKALGVNEPISLSFENTPLQDVIKAFRDTTGANIVTTGTNLNSLVVSMRLDNIPWKQGLDSILAPHDLEAVEQPAGTGIFVIRNKSTVIPKFTKAFRLSYARAQDVAQLFKTTFDLAMPTVAAPAPVGSGINGTVSSFPSANTVIVTASQQQLDECEKILAQIDVQRPQVYIEARFMELSANASRKLGLKWDKLGHPDGWGVGSKEVGFGQTYSRDRTSTISDDSTRQNDNDNGVPDIARTDLTTVGKTFSEIKNQTFSGALSADDFRLALNAFDKLDDTSIFSNPRVIVANEEQATIDMTKKVPNLEITSTPVSLGDRQSIQVTARLAVIPGKNEMNVGEAFFSYGITLKVTPRVSPTGLITVVIEPAISDSTEEYVIASNSDMPLPRYPIIDVKRINTTFTMNDGYTAVIGGLTQTKEESVDSGIPYMRKIPLLGQYLFGWKSRQKVQKEIVIFVTVGLTDPATMKRDAGLPKNAVLGREYLTGARKEPGDRTKSELMSLNMDRVDKKQKAEKAPDQPAEVSAPAVEPIAPVPAASPAPAVPIVTPPVEPATKPSTEPVAPVPVAPAVQPLAVPAEPSPAAPAVPATAEPVAPAPEKPVAPPAPALELLQ